jgi:hypothetical protein
MYQEILNYLNTGLQMSSKPQEETTISKTIYHQDPNASNHLSNTPATATTGLKLITLKTAPKPTTKHHLPKVDQQQQSTPSDNHKPTQLQQPKQHLQNSNNS